MTVEPSCKINHNSRVEVVEPFPVVQCQKVHVDPYEGEQPAEDQDRAVPVAGRARQLEVALDLERKEGRIQSLDSLKFLVRKPKLNSFRTLLSILPF